MFSTPPIPRLEIYATTAVTTDPIKSLTTSSFLGLSMDLARCTFLAGQRAADYYSHESFDLAESWAHQISLLSDTSLSSAGVQPRHGRCITIIPLLFYCSRMFANHGTSYISQTGRNPGTNNSTIIQRLVVECLMNHGNSCCVP